MEQRVEEKTSSFSSSSISLLKEAASFLENLDNTKKTWRGLSYNEVFELVKNFVQGVEPQSNLENISVENLIGLLNKIFTEEEHLESVVPQNLQILLQDSEEAEGKTKVFEQRASLKVKNFLEKEKLLLKRRQKQQVFLAAAGELINQKVEKTSLSLPADKQEKISQTIAAELPQKTNLKLTWEKTTKLSLEEKNKEEQNLSVQLHQLFNQAANTAITKLQQEGISLTETEKEAVFIRLRPSFADLPLITQQIALPVEERREIVSWINESLSPLAPKEEAKNIIATLAPAIIQKLPEIKPETIDQISEKEFSELQKTFTEKTMVTLAELAPEIKEIPPQKINQLLSVFIPQKKEDLKEYSSVLTIAKENREISPPLFSVEKIEVTQLPTAFPRFFAPPLQRAAEGNIWQTQNQAGLTFVEEIRTKLIQEGINKNNSFAFRNKVLDQWALYLTAAKIIPEDIDYTIEKLLSAGEKIDSLRIQELKETRKKLAFFQQALPPPLLEKIKKENFIEGKKGNYPVQIPSRFGTIIIRKTSFDPKFNLSTRINSFLGKIFGKQTIVLPSGQTIVVNKFVSLRHRFAEVIKTSFFKTTFGQGVKTVLSQLGQKSLQTLWDTVKIGAKKGTSLLLAKVGLQAVATAVAPVVGNILAFVATSVFKTSFSLLKKATQLLTSGFGMAEAIFGGLTGQREVPEDKSLSFVKYVVLGLFIIIPGIALFETITTSGAFIVPTSATRYVGPFPPIVISPGCTNLTTVIGNAATRNCVPPALLMAISRMEAGGVWGWSCEDVAKYSRDQWWTSATPGELIAGYCYDTCAATGLCSGLTVMGPMQFEGGTWKGIMPEYTSNNTPYPLMDRCRLDLSIEAAARKIKGDSGTGANNCGPWNEATVRQVAKSYCGSCGLGGCQNPANPPNECNAACGGEGVDYCENVWLLYKQYANQ